MNTVDVKNATNEMSAQRTTMHQGFKLIKRWKKRTWESRILGPSWDHVLERQDTVGGRWGHVVAHFSARSKQQTGRRAAYIYPPFSL